MESKANAILKSGKEFRLVTRSDFDGLVCAMLLKELGILHDILFVHPKDMQDGKVEVTENDITTNLPYVEGVYMCFDHHSSELSRKGEFYDNQIIDPDSPSAARVVYDFFGGAERFKRINFEIMEEVDRADAAQFEIDEVLHPKDWVLLSFLMDARTGLGRFHHFRISNYNLMMDLIDYCLNHSIKEVLALPDVKERVDLYFEHEERFKEMLRENSTVRDNILVVNLMDQDPIYPGNRFMKYALYPECTVSIQVVWGRQKQNVVFLVGKSIFDRSSEADIGEVMLNHGGGGHKAAGTCPCDPNRVEETLEEVIQELKASESSSEGFFEDGELLPDDFDQQ